MPVGFRDHFGDCYDPLQFQFVASLNEVVALVSAILVLLPAMLVSFGRWFRDRLVVVLASSAEHSEARSFSACWSFDEQLLQTR
jgi:hypothetical protein